MGPASPSSDPGSALGNVSAAPDLAALPGVRHFIEDVAREVNLAPEQTFNLKVAVSEACANAIEHATRRTGSVEIEARRSNDRLTVSVLSQSSFHHRMESSQARRHRGFGLPLMVALTDEVCISRLRGGGVRVQLSLFLEDAV